MNILLFACRLYWSQVC